MELEVTAAKPKVPRDSGLGVPCQQGPAGETAASSAVTLGAEGRWSLAASVLCEDGPQAGQPTATWDWNTCLQTWQVLSKVLAPRLHSTCSPDQGLNKARAWKQELRPHEGHRRVRVTRPASGLVGSCSRQGGLQECRRTPGPPLAGLRGTQTVKSAAAGRAKV